MAKIIYTDELEEGTALSIDHREWIYNTLDACLTAEIWDSIREGIVGQGRARRTYDYILASLAPALGMMERGILVDPIERLEQLSQLDGEIEEMGSYVGDLTAAVCGEPRNPLSPQQLIDFFYTRMKLPPVFIRVKGQRRLSAGREALEKLCDYTYAEPICRAILAYRDLYNWRKVLRSGVDSDGRLRCSFNVTGTVTLRWSSSKNVFGGGCNIQNITPKMRSVFIADPGYILFYRDLEQAESRAVAWLSDDSAYKLACESGDLHTTVAKMTWRSLPWPEDLAAARAIAEEPYYRHLSRRDLAKKLGHGSNYYGKPPTMAKHAKIEVKVAEAFQDSYFGAFPGIRRWHGEVAEELQRTGKLRSVFDFERTFFGRLFEDDTLRGAIAHGPQHLVARIMNEGLIRTWNRLEPLGLQCLAQVHDALLGQVPDTEEGMALLAASERTMETPVRVRGSILRIPTDVKIGYNWRDMMKPTKHTPGSRPPARSLLDVRLARPRAA